MPLVFNNVHIYFIFLYLVLYCGILKEDTLQVSTLNTEWTRWGTLWKLQNTKQPYVTRSGRKELLFPVDCKLSYSTRPAELHGCLCFLLSPVIVFKLNFNLLVCLQRKMKSNQLITLFIYIYTHTHTHTHTYTYSKYECWIVHIAEGAGKMFGSSSIDTEEWKRMTRLNVDWGGKCETLEAEMFLPLPLLLFTLWACVRLWMAAAGRCMEPVLAWDDDWYGHVSLLREDEILDGIPIQPGVNFASFCPLNGPVPPASRPLSPPSLHLIRSAGVEVPLIRPIRL